MSVTKIYIGNLPFSLSENEIEKIIKRYTEVRSVRLVKDPISGESRGFGFVEVLDPEKIIDKLDEKKYRGHTLIVKLAVDRGNW